MNSNIFDTYIFVLAIFIGFQLISKVPSILHTPLMSGTNAIHGVILVGAIALASTSSGWLGVTISAVAVVLGTINVVGGFVVTDRILGMFKRKSDAPASSREGSRNE
jgi:NAD(P) transhydrogenase subunit alpha